MTASIEIRKALDTDAEAISQLVCENATSILFPHYSKAQQRVFLKYYSSKMMREKIQSQQIFCAVYHQQIVGTIALSNDFVLGFYTKLGFLNRGIGKTLLGYIEKIASEKGLAAIQLASSPDGVGFYQKYGWTIIKKFEIKYLGIPFEETLMVKNLQTQLPATSQSNIKIE
jgi:ribosomal protein S18 acetylase RimI-like enzyme